MGGAALLFRLLCEYPRGQAMILQSRDGEGYERLPYTSYQVLTKMRLVPSRLPALRGLVSLMQTRIQVASLAMTSKAFQPQAVLSVTHGDTWLAAWDLARRLGLPLHLICHDDWEHFLPVPPFFRGWTRKLFGAAYRTATSRLCVSPYMEAYYRQQYGAPGTVLYPGRAKDVIASTTPPSPRSSGGFTIAYAGSLHSAYAQILRMLASQLFSINGCLRIFSRLTSKEARHLGLDAPNIVIEPVLPPTELIRALRNGADALVLVMTEPGLGSRICFPSKLVDYTATGLPIIIAAPRESAPAYWAGEHPSAALFVEAGDVNGLREAVVALANDSAKRLTLGARAQEIGNDQFSYTRARDTFFSAVRRRLEN